MQFREDITIPNANQNYNLGDLIKLLDNDFSCHVTERRLTGFQDPVTPANSNTVAVLIGSSNLTASNFSDFLQPGESVTDRQVDNATTYVRASAPNQKIMVYCRRR